METPITFCISYVRHILREVEYTYNSPDIVLDCSSEALVIAFFEQFSFLSISVGVIYRPNGMNYVLPEYGFQYVGIARKFNGGNSRG